MLARFFRYGVGITYSRSKDKFWNYLKCSGALSYISRDIDFLTRFDPNSLRDLINYLKTIWYKFWNYLKCTGALSYISRDINCLTRFDQKFQEILSTISKIFNTRSLGALRVPTSSWRPFGPLDFVLCALSDAQAVWPTPQWLDSVLACGWCVSLLIVC